MKTSKQFDPLILIMSGNEDIKAAYAAGVDFGREKEREVEGVKLRDAEDAIQQRVAFIETRKVLPRRNTESKHKDRERKWYAAGYLDALKIFNRHFPNPTTIQEP